MTRLSLFISPCPNDTFMFHAMTHGLIDTEGLSFDLHFHDIEELNNIALSGQADICKVSYAVVPEITDKYMILRSGSALGFGNGPLLVSRHKIYPDELHDTIVAVPGLHTTANRLLTNIFPEIKERRPYLFSDIAAAVMDGETDAGVLIHEGRFTYTDIGLKLVADLGTEWERLTGMPVPLGAIMVNRRLPEELRCKSNRVLRRSIEFAMANRQASRNFVESHAQELSREVTESHIRLFVNDFSVDLGNKGTEAVSRFLGNSPFEFLTETNY